MDEDNVAFIGWKLEAIEQTGLPRPKDNVREMYSSPGVPPDGLIVEGTKCGVTSK